MLNLRKTEASTDAMGEVLARLETAIGRSADTARSARFRLERARDRRTRIARIGAVAVLAGWGIAVAGFVIGGNSPVVGLVAAGGALVPAAIGFAALWWFARRDPLDEVNAGIAMEAARRGGDEARRILDAIRRSEEEFGAWHASSTMASNLAATVLDLAAATQGWENRVRNAEGQGGRRHERIVPRRQRVVLTTDDNRKMIVQVTDVSLSGAGIEGNLPGVEVGSTVRLGSHAATVMRRTPRGFGIQFTLALLPAQLHPDIVL